MSKRLIQDLHAGISRRDWSAVETVANRLRDEVERTVAILARTDISSLPNDYPLSKLAADAMSQSPKPQTAGHLRAQGIGRDPENDRVVFLSLNRIPSDDEVRAIHGAIQRPPSTCPFCSKPTYVLPCSHCGEPDVPDQF